MATPKAAVVSINWETEESMVTVLSGLHPSDNADPITWAYGFIKSIEDDWPGFDHQVIGNEKASKLRSDYLLEGLGIKSE